MFVAFEGGDGAGKSTQVRLLAAALRADGHQVRTTREPGDGPIGPQIRELLLGHTHAALSDRAEALLFAADRAEHVAAVIRPALAEGSVVITDRYVDSSIAYQGVGRGLGVEAIVALSQFATEGLRPDLTVVIDLPTLLGRARLAGVRADRIERESDALHARVRQAFLDQARSAPERYLLVDGAQPPEVIAESVAARVKELLG